MGLPDMARPAEPSSESRLTYTDGSSRTVYATDVEKPFPEGRLIVSRTDLNGIITHANDAFVEMSGWAREELIGAPHHILRHPDMPKIAFKGLWDDIAALMAGIGISGIPDAGLIVLPLVLATVGLPETVIVGVIPVLFSVDWLIGRVRSGVNVMSDILVAPE